MRKPEPNGASGTLKAACRRAPRSPHAQLLAATSRSTSAARSAKGSYLSVRACGAPAFSRVRIFAARARCASQSASVSGEGFFCNSVSLNAVSGRCSSAEAVSSRVSAASRAGLRQSSSGRKERAKAAPNAQSKPKWTRGGSSGQTSKTDSRKNTPATATGSQMRGQSFSNSSVRPATRTLRSSSRFSSEEPGLAGAVTPSDSPFVVFMDARYHRTARCQTSLPLHKRTFAVLRMSVYTLPASRSCAAQPGGPLPRALFSWGESALSANAGHAGKRSTINR